MSNVHGASTSYNAFRWLEKEPIGQDRLPRLMSDAETRDLLNKAGLMVVRKAGDRVVGGKATGALSFDRVLAVEYSCFRTGLAKLEGKHRLYGARIE